MNDLVTVLRAAEAAARWHVTHKRKGEAKEPYINHLLEVASLVATATREKDPELVVAALLHDAIEDQGVSRETIAQSFSEGVAELVQEVTDDKSLPKETRKELQVEHANSSSARAKLLKLADKISNLRAVATSPAPEWPVQRRLEYVKWAENVAVGLHGVNPSLDREFTRAALEARSACS